ncbi:hypothetical protein GCM10010431_28650 [Streptomyces kunmingensis]
MEDPGRVQDPETSPNGTEFLVKNFTKFPGGVPRERVANPSDRAQTVRDTLRREDFGPCGQARDQPIPSRMS